MASASKAKVVSSSNLAARIAQFALDKKAEKVVSLNVKDLTSIADEFVICSSDTNIQVKAIADSIRKSTDTKPIRVEGYEHLNWVLLDYIDVIVHIFKTAERNYYNIEKLWGDAPIREFNDEDCISTEALIKSLSSLEYPENNIQLSPPNNSEFGDLSTNVALTLSKDLKQNPMNIGKAIVDNLTLPEDLIDEVTISQPGFINFKIS